MFNKFGEFNFNEKLYSFKDDFIKSKKYWIIYLILILLGSSSIMGIDNYLHPKMEIGIICLLSLLGVFCITYYQRHNNDKELYKITFIIILTFGIICSFLNPILYAPDEVEHFVRAEMITRGIFFPEYNTTPFLYEGSQQKGFYLTIQTTLDLIEDGKNTADTGWDEIIFKNASIFHTKNDLKPINNTLVKYPSAFAQNPFYGYVTPAIGIFLAKILNLNAIWLMWLGRLFNTTLYAILVSIAIKKTPILKIPLIVIACMPLTLFQSASISIDSLINGMGILIISYFLYMYNSNDKLNKKDLIIFSLMVILLGLCKITYFGFIFLLLIIPKQNFKSNKNYLYIISTIIFICIIAALWSKYFVTPGFSESFRGNYCINGNINVTQQFSYITAHKKEFLVALLSIPQYLEKDLIFNSWSLAFNTYNPIYLMFLGGICFFYPNPKIDIKSRIGALLILIIIYYGTYITFLLSWNPIGKLYPIEGVLPRYFLPELPLIPFIFGFNNNLSNKKEIDYYIIIIMLSFLSMMLISMVIKIY